MTQLVRYESDGIVSTIIMDDGKANVLSPSMLRELNAAVDRAEAETKAAEAARVWSLDLTETLPS